MIGWIHTFYYVFCCDFLSYLFKSVREIVPRFSVFISYNFDVNYFDFSNPVEGLGESSLWIVITFLKMASLPYDAIFESLILSSSSEGIA